MPHAFDTGLAAPQRTLIRDAVVALLAGLDVANGGYLRRIVPWGGVVRGYTDEAGIGELWNALSGASPAIAVAVGDRVSNPAGAGAFNFKGDLELVIYHYNTNARSLTLGRTKADARGAAAVPNLAGALPDPGLEVAMEHAEELVLGQLVGAAEVVNVVGERTRRTPSIGRIRPTREEELVTMAEGTLWAQRYAVEVQRTINPKRGVTQMLEELRTIIRPTDVDTDVAAADEDPPGDTVVGLNNEANT